MFSGQIVEICMLEMRELKTEVGNLCNQINGKCVYMIVSAANFAMSNNNRKYPQISSYDYKKIYFQVSTSNFGYIYIQ